MDCLELDLGNATYSGYDSDGFLTVSWDSYGNEDGNSAPGNAPVAGTAAFEAHHPLGFVGRPLDPLLDPDGNADPTQSCNVMIGLMGGKGHAWPLEATRVMPLLPQLRKGESMMYGPAWGQFCRMHEDGKISFYTTIGQPASDVDNPGDPIYFEIDPNAGPSQGFNLVGPWGKLMWGPSGFHVRMFGGPSLDLGPIGGAPGPLAALANYFAVSAAMSTLNSSIVATGTGKTPNAGAPAMAVPLLAILAEMMAAVSVALASIPSSAPTGGQAAATALASAIAPLLIQIAPCIPFAFPPVPKIPSPFSIPLPKLPRLNFSANVCCVTWSLPELIPVLPIAIPINIGLITAVNEALSEVQAFLDSLSLSCPRLP